MKIKLCYAYYPFPEGSDFTLRLPKNLRNLRPGPPEFLWLRFKIEKPPGRGMPHYVGDGTMGVSNHHDGQIIYPVPFSWCVRIASRD